MAGRAPRIAALLSVGKEPDLVRLAVPHGECARLVAGRIYAEVKRSSAADRREERCRDRVDMRSSRERPPLCRGEGYRDDPRVPTKGRRPDRRTSAQTMFLEDRHR